MDYSKALANTDSNMLARGKLMKQAQPVLETKAIFLSGMDPKYKIVQVSIDDPLDKSFLESLVGVTKISYTRIYSEGGQIRVQRKNHSTNPFEYFDWPNDLYLVKPPDIGK